MFNTALLMNKPPSAGVPTRSLSFTQASSMSLSMSNADFGARNADLWSMAVALKRASIGASTYIYSKYDGTNAEFYLRFNSGNKLDFFAAGSGGNYSWVSTTAYTNTTDFMAVLLHFDKANATSTNRIKVYVNNSLETPASTIYPGTGDTINNNTAANLVVGGNDGAFTGAYFDGLQFQPSMWSGILAPTTDVFDGSGGKLKDLSLIAGGKQLLSTNATDALEDDFYLVPNFTNNNTVTKSTTVPT